MPPLFKLLRPKQWIKSGFVIAPILFAQQYEVASAWVVILRAALAFALAASAVYIVNDFCDRAEDRLHPVKSKRPLAAGTVGVPAAMMLAALCVLLSGLLLLGLPAQCVWVVAVYAALNVFYSLFLKKYALLDVFFIASCFVLRVLMGCFALAVMISPWIILTTFMLALFLGFGKRYHELGIEGYAAHKQNLQHYSRELLDRLVVICGASALVCYAIYTADIATHTGNVDIVYTVAFVAFGLFRYLQSIYVRGQGGEPESVILKDRWQWINIALWLATTLIILGQ
ncbi:MAG: UbiA prenyltransferase family protein [Alphaproteobacteria bacterium]|nr:UbiA prenyltransferase family protein [Alphaproteobacteria bacterium]